jgi:peptide/nickel transport system substrate-binding protein
MGAGAAVLAACDGGEEEAPADGTGGSPTGAAGGPVHGGRHLTATTMDWGKLDPMVSVGAASVIFPRMYNVLVDRSRTDPSWWFFDLAENVEQPDEETYLFAIRPGVRIAPNDLDIPERDLDAFDAKAWLDRVNADERVLIRQFTSEWVTSYEAQDAASFTIKTKGPYAYFFFRVGSPFGSTMPPREFFERGIELDDQGVGAGPFKLRPGSYQETGGLSLDRNVNYYGRDFDNNNAQLPYVDGTDIVRITDRLARRTAFADGQIYQYGVENRAERDELLQLVADSYATEGPVNTFISFIMNPTREPWGDERIRKAALHALNRQEFVDRIVGPEEGKPNGLIHWPLGPFALDQEELEELQPHDPQRSRELIREATGEDTIRISMMYPTGVDIQFHDQHVPIFIQQMKEAGFDIDEEPLDLGTWLAREAAVDYDASLAPNQTYETAEITLDWHLAVGPTGGSQYIIGLGVLFPEIDEAILSSKRTTDPEEHVKRVLDAQRLIYEKGPAYLPIMSWISYTLHHGFVKDITTGLGNAGGYVNTWWLDL